MALLSYLIKEGVKSAAKSAAKSAQSKATEAVVATAAAAVTSSVIAANASKKQIQANAAGNGNVATTGVMVNPSRYSEDYCNDSVADVVRELLGAGFLRVTVRPEKKLPEKKAKKYGKISSISINGKKYFSDEDVMPQTAYIVIQYLEFEDNVNQAIYERVEKIIPGTWQCH